MNETVLSTKILFGQSQNQNDSYIQDNSALDAINNITQTNDSFPVIFTVVVALILLASIIGLAVAYKKKFLSVILSSVLIFSIFLIAPAKSFAAQNISINSESYINDEGVAEITFTNNDVYPASIDSFKIVNTSLPLDTTWNISIVNGSYEILNASNQDNVCFDIPAQTSYKINVKPNYDMDFPQGELAGFEFISTSNHYSGKYINIENEVNTPANFDFSFTKLINADNTQLNRDIASFEAVAAMTPNTYNNIILDGCTYDVSNRIALMKNVGFKDNIYRKLWPDHRDDTQADDGVVMASADYTQDVNDVTSFSFGHRKINFGDHNTEIINISVAGTGGDFEWASNFDIGADVDAYYQATGEHPEWTNKADHKGFDIAKNRLMTSYNSYVANYIDQSPNTEKIILVNGHSRGAAIAGLIARDLIDLNSGKTFCYTFAAPNTTSVTPNASYDSIFNFLNLDDIVCLFPAYISNFYKYGTDIPLSVYAGIGIDGVPLSTTFEKTSGYGEYQGSSPEDINELINSTKALIESRNDAYTLESPNSKVFTKLGTYDNKPDAEYACAEFKDGLNEYKLNYYVGDIDVVQDEYEDWVIQFKACAAFLVQDISNMLFVYRGSYKGPYLGYNDTLIKILEQALGIVPGVLHGHILASYNVLAKYSTY